MFFYFLFFYKIKKKKNLNIYHNYFLEFLKRVNFQGDMLLIDNKAFVIYSCLLSLLVSDHELIYT